MLASRGSLLRSKAGGVGAPHRYLGVFFFFCLLCFSGVDYPDTLSRVLITCLYASSSLRGASLRGRVFVFACCSLPLLLLLSSLLFPHHLLN
jgi:hypothetical protein